MECKVSVFMPVYNGGPFLKEAIDSILSQTYTNYEFVIVNDGSVDNTKAIIESYTDERIRVIHNERNLGIIKTRNIGLANCSGDYIVCMDSDDISISTRIEKQLYFLEAYQDVDVLATKLILIDEKGIELGYSNEDYNNVTVEQIKAILPVINCIGQPSVMMRSNVVKSVGYNELFPANEDWGLWLTLLSQNCVVAKLDEVLVKYRIHSSSTTIIANKKGVGDKILSFKYSYLKDKMQKMQFKKLDTIVFISFLKDILKYKFSFIYKVAKKLRVLRPLEMLKQWFRIQNYFNSKNSKAKLFFFFPSYHTGGADKVHASILETVANKNNVVFITSRSDSKALLPAFEKSAIIFDVDQLLVLPFFRKWLSRKIVVQCQINSELILFGCNSNFFYDVVSNTPEKQKCIDLIHAFSHPNEDSPEKWSLPVIEKLWKRIVINNKTKTDLIELYAQKGIEKSSMERIFCIPNFVEKKDFPEKNMHNILKVIYVGRGTGEKRVHLLARVARLIGEKKTNVQFHFIGDMKGAINTIDLPFCVLHGEIRDEAILQNIYLGAHMLVMSSSREGFPMVIMEAMMNGVVAISTNVGGISEHIVNHVNGFLIHAKDENQIVKELAETIIYCSNHLDELAKISKNAHSYAVEHFNKEVFFNSYAELLS